MRFSTRVGFTARGVISLPPRAINGRCKSLSCVLRPAFFARHRLFQERALDGLPPHEKSAQLSLSAFALVVIRLETENVKVGKSGEREIIVVVY